MKNNDTLGVVPIEKIFLKAPHHRAYLTGERNNLHFRGTGLPMFTAGILLVLSAIFFLYLAIVDLSVRPVALLVSVGICFGVIAVLRDIRRHRRLIRHGQVVYGEIIQSRIRRFWMITDVAGIPWLKREQVVDFSYRFYTPFGGAIEKTVKSLPYVETHLPKEGLPIAVLYVDERCFKLL